MVGADIRKKRNDGAHKYTLPSHTINPAMLKNVSYTSQSLASCGLL